MSESPSEEWRTARHALARRLTELERRDGAARDWVARRRAAGPIPGRRVLLCGPPGAGKSSLLREIVRRLRAPASGDPERVGVLAFDPSSPYTRGAFLGDRVRWAEFGEDDGLFVRSLAHRDPGSIVPAVAIDLADALGDAGCEWIFVETVGAGQNDVPDPSSPFLRVLVLAPGQGDETQMLKAGFLESGDVYVVSKGDLPGASRWARLLEDTLSSGRDVSSGRDASLAPPVVLLASSQTGAGVEEVIAALRARSSGASPRASAGG